MTVSCFIAELFPWLVVTLYTLHMLTTKMLSTLYKEVVLKFHCYLLILKWD